MQIVTMIGQMLESGKITISTKNTKTIEIIANNKKIDVNAQNKKLIKDIISSVRAVNKNNNLTGRAKEIPEMLKTVNSAREMLIDVAEELTESGITVTLSYKGNIVATIGTQANARLSRLVTGTKAIEINSLAKLVELGI